MDIVIHIFAVIVGSSVAYFSVDYLLTIYYHRNFVSKNKYEALYDELDSEYHYKTLNKINDNKYGSYAAYLEHHQEFKDSAYEMYKKIMLSIIGKLGTLLTAPVLAAGFFGSSVIGILIASLAAGIIYLAWDNTHNKKHRADFYITLVHSLVLKR